MALVIDPHGSEGERMLDAAGVRLHRISEGAGDVDAVVVASVLPEGEREVRAVADIDVPADPDAGMGAWHVNPVDELHVVVDGEGVMQFVTLDGVVTVMVGAGDVIEIRGAEHRYRPLTPQRWILRYGGPAGADLDPVETGRAAGPWPSR